MKNLITILSLIWLIALTFLASFATYMNNAFSLPIAKIIPAVAIVLPSLSGIALKVLDAVQQRNMSEDSAMRPSRLGQILVTAFLITETVIATLVSTHLASNDDLTCPLQERWKQMYMNKDATRIRRIQDALNCCGFRTPRDMPYPFPQGQQGTDTCMVRYDRDASCMNRWAASERTVALLLLLVPTGLFLWQVVLYVTAKQHDPWLPSTIRLPPDAHGNAENAQRQRRAIAYPVADEESDMPREVSLVSNEPDSAVQGNSEPDRMQPTGVSQERQDIWTSM